MREKKIVSNKDNSVATRFILGAAASAAQEPGRPVWGMGELGKLRAPTSLLCVDWGGLERLLGFQSSLPFESGGCLKGPRNWQKGTPVLRPHSEMPAAWHGNQPALDSWRM